MNNEENRDKLTQVDILKIIHSRRSIRQFDARPVSDETLKKIMEAAIRAPGGSHMYSMIYTRDPDKIKDLKTLGIYPTTKVFFVFFIDIRKLEKIVKQRGYEYEFDDGMAMWLSIQETTLAVENFTLAAEAYGLGSVLLGAPPLKADLVSKVFNVPKRVFPVVGMCLGYPDDSVKTDIRPRFPLKLCAYEDSYRDLSDEEIKDGMRAMDEDYITQGYYQKHVPKHSKNDTEKGTIHEKYSWSEHVARHYGKKRLDKEKLLPIIQRYGFNVK